MTSAFATFSILSSIFENMIDYPKAMFNEHLVDSIVCGYSRWVFHLVFGRL
jgi:hypothetical protein